jgi:hypothetical protein
MKRNPQFFLVLVVLLLSLPALGQSGASPFYDYRAERPGTIHKVTVSDLPPPNATKSANNFPEPNPRPAGAMPSTVGSGPRRSLPMPTRS